MPIMFLLCGNIGTGKSHLARKLARREGGIIVEMDSIAAACHGGELDRYDSNLKDVYHAAEKALIAKAYDLGAPVIINRTNINRATRSRYIRYWRKRGGDVLCVNFGPGDRTSMKRRILQAKGSPRTKWANIHLSNADRWEEPMMDEEIDDILDYQNVSYKFWVFDFDGGVVKDQFPGVGQENGAVVNFMRLVDEEPTNCIIVQSERTKDYLFEARQWLVSENVPFDYLNENPLYLPNSRKIYGDFIIPGSKVITPESLEDDQFRYETSLL